MASPSARSVRRSSHEARAPFSAIREAARRGRSRPGQYEEYTRAQRRWVWMRGRTMLWRAANRVGKTRGQCKKLMHFLAGTGPYADRRPGPVKVLVMTISKEQAIPLHEMIWQLLPKDQIDPAVQFAPGFGFRGKPPRVTFTAGPAKGSVITFASYKQGTKRIAGANFDAVLLDEPPPQELWGEVLGRVVHGSPGEIWISFTNTPDSPDVTYLRKKVEAGEIAELHTPLTVDNVTLESGRPLVDQAAIDAFASSLLELEKDMRLNGGWDAVLKDRALTNWGRFTHIQPARPPLGATLVVGIDQGAGSGKQTAALLAITQSETALMPRVWLLEEYVGEGFTTPEQDARGILAMLKRRGFDYDDVDAWVGDRASGVNAYGVRKTNKLIRLHMARILGREADDLAYIEVPYKYPGSVDHGFRMVNAVMGRVDELGFPHFIADPDCPKFAEAARTWRGARNDPKKDILDAVRYACEKVVQIGAWYGFQAIYS